MINGKKSYEELSLEEQQGLASKYGIQPKTSGGFSKYKVEYVRELNEDEKKFFQDKNFLSPYFLTQSLYKLRGSLEPIRFNMVLKEKIRELPALRTNYAMLGDKIVAVVFENRIDLPSVSFRRLTTMGDEEIDKNLRIIMEADMREKFEITRGSLIRFSIYKTREDEYAVLVTMSHLIFSEISMTEIFREALGLSVEKNIEQANNKVFRNVSAPAVRAYWQNLLDNLPPLPKIPYITNKYLRNNESKVCRKKISGDLSGELQRIAKSNRMFLMAFIETAWGILLSEYNNVNDVFFSALLPDKNANFGVKAPSVVAMPVRIKINDGLTIEQLVLNTFQQLVISKPYSSIQVDELQEISGASGRIFNHFLSFYDFMEEEKEYSKTRGSENGELIRRNSWNSIPTHIGLYFQHENGSVALTLMYNANSFENSGETRLIEGFFRVILQMINDYSLTVPIFMSRLKERIKAEEPKGVEKPSIEFYVRYAILSIDIFSKLNSDEVAIIQNKAKIKTLFEGTRISEGELSDNIVCLIKGRAARNVDAGDGWYNTLDILKERSILNLTSVFLEKPRLPMSIEILTDEAEVVFIKKESLETLIKKNSLVGKNLLIYALKEMEKYQYLWIQS